MPRLDAHLVLPRCPHCGVDKPNLDMLSQHRTHSFSGGNPRWWKFYTCKRCGGVVTAAARDDGAEVLEIFPRPLQIDEAVPERARAYLRQALDSVSAPAGAIMLAASSVDAMLKAKDYTTGSLYSRIDKAAEDHVITEDMAKWAHEVRLDANEQRHADEEAPLPEEDDARHAIEFAIALGQFMFVLPARVQRGLKEAAGTVGGAGG